MLRNRRRKYSIDSAVQGALTRRLLCHWLAFCGLCTLILPIWQVINGGALKGPFLVLMQEAWIEMIPVFVLMVLLLPMFVWDTIKLSNRFAGPMYRFRTVLRSMAAGENVRPIQLRRGDFWTDVADDINAVAQRLEGLKQKPSRESQVEENQAEKTESLALAGNGK